MRALSRKLFLVIAIVVVSATAFLSALPAKADYLSNTYVRLDRMKTGVGTSVRVVFRTSATNGTEAKVKLTMTGFTVNATQTIATAACATETGATALPGSLSASGNNTTKEVTVTGVSDLSTSTTYCFDLTSSTAVTNPAAGSYNQVVVQTLTSGDVQIDTRDVGLRIISDDQIVISAVVPPIFNFALSGNTDAFTGNLDPLSVVSTGGRTATVTTNAAKGWIVWVKDLNQGLSSASAPYTIATTGTVDGSPSTLSAGTEGYVLDVDLTTDAAGGGTVTLAGEYNGTTTSAGGTLSGTYQPVASSNGTGNGDVLTLIERAAINGATPAGTDYTDTLNVIAAGAF